MFEPRGPKASPLDAPPAYEPDDIELADDPSVYRPWTIQRGRSRPPLMLELRKYEPRSGVWSGWQLSYPSLIAVEYVGDTMLSLDFGSRQFVIEGCKLSELARHLQQGTVIAIQEYANSIWSSGSSAERVTSIRRIGAPEIGVKS